MRIILAAAIPVCMGIVFLSACNRNSVHLDYTNAKDEVPQLANLEFRFDKTLVGDSLLDKWDSTTYISFEPKIPGRFRWEHGDELVFSPARPLPASTSFTATLNRNILQFSKYGKIMGADALSFHTPELKLENTNVSWVLPDAHSATAVPQVVLSFNYPVNPASLNEKMQIQVNGQPGNYNLQTLSADSRVVLRLANVKIQDQDYLLKIVIGQGLIPEGGTNGLSQAIEANSGMASLYVLRVNDVTTEHDGITGTIKVSTSQGPVAADIASYITIVPKVKFTVENQEDGFLIHSDHFDVEKSYTLTIAKGLRGIIGGVLKETYDGNVAFGQLEPSISFASKKSIYLSGKGEKNVEVRITNVQRVKVIVSKIYENNLLGLQRTVYYPNEQNNDNNDEADQTSDDAVLGDVIYQQEIDTRSLPEYGNSRIYHFSIDDRLPEFKGIYHLMIRSAKDYWVRDSRLVSLSDIGMIAKEGKDKILVFANSIQTARPVNGVNVIAYGANNQLLGMAATNSEGVAEIAISRRDFAGFKPAMIIAKTADDFNYLPFASAKVNTSKFDVGGKYINSTGLDAFVYEERDIYRPGEKINFSVVVRDGLWKSPGEIPLKMKFLLPNGKELKSFRKTLNEQGSLEGNIEIAASAITGSYSLEVYTSNDVLLTTQSFKIEEFVPDRIKVIATLDKALLQSGDTSTLNIHAANFFGPPAADRNYQCEIQVKQVPFRSRKYDNYDFSLANQNSFFDKIEREGKTDRSGNATESFDVKPAYKNIGVLRATFYTTVFDETGRPVSRNPSVNIYTQDKFFGIADDGYWFYPLNQKLDFSLIALDREEKLLTGAEAEVDVVKHEYRTVLAKSGDYFRYESQQDDKLVESHLTRISGASTLYAFIPRSPGDYELRVYIPGSNSYVSKAFYSYGSWGAENSSFEVNNEGQIDIQLDKTAYYAGDNSRVLFKTPFDGRMLVTLETDKVISYQYVEVNKRAAWVDFPLTAVDMPNVYVTATLIKPHDVSDIPLTVAHGFQNIKVEDKERKIPVELVAQKSVRSRTHQKATVKAEPNCLVTLAAVDNGVLQVSNFETPDPYNFFYAKRSLDVSGYDIYPMLFPEIKAMVSSSGGDQEADMKKRVNPMPAKRFKILSYWSGIKQTNSDGNAEFEFDIPQFSGEVRLMAVCYRDNHFGSQEEKMTVADPVVLSTALPRFLSPRDTVLMPVTVSNTTSKSATANATVVASGAVQIVGSASQSVTLGPNSEQRVNFTVVAKPAMGTGKVSVVVSSMGERFTDGTDISVRPVAPLQKITGSGVLSGGNSESVNLTTSDFITASIDYNLVVSRSPAAELAKYLSLLVEYPYGCTEQTVSIAFPQLYYGDLADLLHGGRDLKASANFNVQEAIRKIKMRQLYNGAVSLWDAEATENWWATVYSAHFLFEAQRAGYDVDNSLLSTMLDYINNRLKKQETIVYYYNRNEQKKIAPKEVAYGLYVLALAGKPNISAMNYYRSNPQLLSLDCKYLLSAAFALAGDRNSFKEFLPAQFAGEVSVAQTGGSFYSDIRDEAVALNVLVDVDPNNSQIPLMAKHVADMLKQREWLSTQELAFSFIALGKIYREAAKSTVTAEIKTDGRTVGTMSGPDVKLTAQQLKGTNITLDTKGQGKLYYYWESSGISSSGLYKEEDKYLKVRKHFFDRDGKPIPGNIFKQNDLVVVEITLEKSYSEDIDNVVITDMLPAGFEIENPRLKDVPGMDWIKDESIPTAMDVRDDRINLFVNAGDDRQRYYYTIRAVSPGIYRMGPVSADAMYNGEYHSYNGGSTIKVIQ